MKEKLFRHEYQYEINAMDHEILKRRLGQVLKQDRHGDRSQKYRVRSLYFDTFQDRVLWEKRNGIYQWEVFRLRYYNEDIFHIGLEKKSGYGELYHKIQAPVSYEECTRILSGDISWMLQDPRELLREFYGKVKALGLRPKTMNSYERQAFVFPAGNVRITLDTQVRTAVQSKDFLHMECVPMIHCQGEKTYLLKVKYDAFLPEYLRILIQLDSRSTGGYSKYDQSRCFG